MIRRSLDIRSVISWLETILGIGLIGVGATYFAPLFQDTFGDPHGMGTALGLIASAFGLCLLVSGLSLRIQGRWPWLMQLLPVLPAVLATLFLTGQ